MTRPKGFTDEEAKALLEAADAHRQGNEQPKTSAAKRWVPWLCAYTGARVGEVAQARADTLGHAVFLGDSDETRLVDAILLERNDEWAVQRARYITLESITPMSDDPLVSLPAAAA